MKDDKAPITPRSPRAALEPEQVPPPPKRSRSARHPFVIAGNAVITLIFLAMIGGGALYIYGKQKIEAAGPLVEDKVVNIPTGGISDIADVLQRQGVIDGNRTFLTGGQWQFMGGVLAMGARSELKSGEYLFPKRASMRDVINTMVEGKVVQHNLTVPEGLTSEQIVARLLENDVLSGQIREIPREGTLLPETYRFTRGTTREQLIQRMTQAHRRALQEVWERRNPDILVKSPEQLVVMASIVEKETGRADERSRVAAVFNNRIQKKMKLQSDPTIIYGLVGGKGTLGRPIRRSEISQPTPYNTYVIEGLPPGPIANPGRAALEAVANPARTRDLFFVADGNGGHTFTETYDQHQKNVVKLRSIEKQAETDRVEPDPADAAAAAAAGQADSNANAPAPAGTPAQPTAPPKAAPKAAPKRAVQPLQTTPAVPRT